MTIQTRLEELMTGRVSEMRSGGGLGESRTGTVARSVTEISARSGNSDAMCASGPTPRKQMSNDGHGPESLRSDGANCASSSA